LTTLTEKLLRLISIRDGCELSFSEWPLVVVLFESWSSPSVISNKAKESVGLVSSPWMVIALTTSNTNTWVTDRYCQLYTEETCRCAIGIYSDEKLRVKPNCPRYHCSWHWSIFFFTVPVQSSSRMHVMNHNWLATKQRLHSTSAECPAVVLRCPVLSCSVLCCPAVISPTPVGNPTGKNWDFP